VLMPASRYLHSAHELETLRRSTIYQLSIVDFSSKIYYWLGMLHRTQASYTLRAKASFPSVWDYRMDNADATELCLCRLSFDWPER
jgi:hypothetical protein